MKTRIVDALLPRTLLAPERYVARGVRSGVPLGELVRERSSRAASAAANALVFDTTHAKDGVFDVRSAALATEPPASAKKSLHAGDLAVSRLRTYLRQIAFVHPSMVERVARPLACSTEFYVLSPREDGASIAFLVPFLLSAPVQAELLASQEGGHHPRVPRQSFLAIHVPRALVRRRDATSARVMEALEALAEARSRWFDLLDDGGSGW